MRILFLTPFLPDPAASHGGGSYIGALARAMSRQAELGLLYLGHPAEGHVNRDIWPWHASAAFCGSPQGLAHRTRMLWQWRSRPLLAAKYWQPELQQQIATARREFQPDVALVEMAQMAQYLPALRSLPTIFTDHEAGQPANASTGLGSWADRRDRHLWRRYVRHYYRQASVLQAVTQEDATALAEQSGRATVVRPPTLSMPATACQPGRAPACALFLGDYRHGPNPQAAARLAHEVWPLVRAVHADAQLLLAGPHEQAIRPLADLPGVRVLGLVPDLNELMASVRVVLAPLWSGGGFRVKNATALAHGVPVVTNELGSRGCLAPGAACTVAESAQDLASATAKHLASTTYAAEAGRAARTWASEHFAADRVAKLQLDRIAELLG